MLLLNSKAVSQPGEPSAFEMVFGWMLLGSLDICHHSNATSLFLSIFETLDSTIKLFWELKEVPSAHRFSPDEDAAESIYRETKTRLSSGRFMVALLFQKVFLLLDDSKSVALYRYHTLEYWLNNNHFLRQQYIEFMQDYLTMGHMKLIPLEDKDNASHYYIPHHCVLIPNSNTIKLRVVFNISARTSVSESLKESLYTGPKFSQDTSVQEY